MKKVNRIMEIFWLSLAIVALLMAIYMMTVLGFQDGAIYLVFPGLAGLMYGVRRGLRGTLEKYQDKNKDRSDHTE